MSSASVGDLDARLDTPLMALMLPGRFENHLEDRGMRSVRDVVSHTPAEVMQLRSIGRRTVGDARVILEKHLGMTWEQAHVVLAGPPAMEPASQAPEARWQAIVDSFPRHLWDRRAKGAIPDAVARRAHLRGWERIGDLLGLPFPEIEAIARGVVMLDRTLAAFERAWASAADGGDQAAVSTVGTPASPLRLVRLDDHADWLALFRASLAELPGLRGRIVARRAGLDAEPATLRDAADRHGLSRERARQLECEGLGTLVMECPWIRPLAERLAAARTQRWVMMRDVERADPFFAGATARPHAFAYLANRVLAGDYRVVVWPRGLALVATSDTALDIEPMVRMLERAARWLPFPIDDGARLGALVSATGLAAGEVELVAPILERRWRRDGDRVVGFGDELPVIRALREASEPMLVRELLETFGSGARRPLRRHAVWISSGMVTVASRIPRWEEWCERLARLCREIMETHAPHREWLTHELYDELRDSHVRLPDWINPWSLWSALGRRAEVRVVTRNTVALPRQAARDTTVPRARYASALTRRLRACLESAGGPMAVARAKELLLARRGLRAQGWSFATRRLPVVLVDHQTIGLSPRDVPGGTPAITKVLDEITRRAEASPQGLDGGAIREALSAVGVAWTVELVRSLVREHPKLRIGTGRYIVKLRRATGARA